MLLQSQIKPADVEVMGSFLKNRGITIDSAGDLVENWVAYRCAWMEDQRAWRILPVVKIKNQS